MGIVKERNFNYTVEKSVSGMQEFIFKVENTDVSKAEYVEYDVLDEPGIAIEHVRFPESVEYNDNFKITVLLAKESRSIPKNAEITLSQNNFKKTWTVDELSQDRKFVINLAGKDLRKGINEYDIVVKYEDGNGKGYETKEIFSLELVNVNLVQNIMLVLNQFVMFLNSLVS